MLLVRRCLDASAYRMLSPVINDVDAWAAVTRLVVLVHVHTLNCGPKAARDKLLICLAACEVRAGQDGWHADGYGQGFARVQQP